MFKKDMCANEFLIFCTFKDSRSNFFKIIILQ